MASGPLSLIRLFAFSFILLRATHLNVRALPTGVGNSLVFTGPSTTTTTTHTTDANGNPVIQTCQITFTPSGTDDVVMVESCVDTPDTTGNGGGGGTGSTTTTSADSSTTTASATSTDTASVSVSTTTTASAGTATVGGAVVIGTSTMAASNLPTPPAASTPAASSTTSATGTVASDLGSTTATTTASPTAVAAVNTSLPGKSLSVLPIGLGVFAGLSVIAMVVVGAVTYERTKYRKAFRAKKLEEAGGVMNYGGMAARV